MAYYSSPLIIHNNTEEYKVNKEFGFIAEMKFSVNFNKEKLFLNNTILNQILDSGAVQNYIIKEVSSFFEINKLDIEKTIKGICTPEPFPNIEIKIIGKYFFIRFFGGINTSIDECIYSLRKILKKEKNKISLLRGE